VWTYVYKIIIIKIIKKKRKKERKKVRTTYENEATHTKGTKESMSILFLGHFNKNKAERSMDLYP
jgi:hypothetical protein